MISNFKHGGRYKQASLNAGLSWNDVTDYSTSVNWQATRFYPDSLIYIHQDSIEYPEPSYPELTELIYNTYKSSKFTITNGANDAIARLFQALSLLGINKEIVLLGSAYLEYPKYASLNKFSFTYESPETFLAEMEKFRNKIIVIVNPNTPYGYFTDLTSFISELEKLDSLLIVDESFADFTSNKTLLKSGFDSSNLIIIKSLTKFYGSAGARLGFVTTNNSEIQELISDLTPPWSISTYDDWFYRQMIPKYNQIKKETLKWISEETQKLKSILMNSENIKLFDGSQTSYHTLEFNPEFLKNKEISNFQEFLLKEYKIYVRPTFNFWNSSETSFRIGLRLPEENTPLFNALKELR